MMTAIKLLKLKPNKPAAHLDDYLLRDLGVSRIESEFGPHTPLQFDGNNPQITAEEVPLPATPSHKAWFG